MDTKLVPLKSSSIGPLNFSPLMLWMDHQTWLPIGPPVLAHCKWTTNWTTSRTTRLAPDWPTRFGPPQMAYHKWPTTDHQLWPTRNCPPGESPQIRFPSRPARALEGVLLAVPEVDLPPVGAVLDSAPRLSCGPDGWICCAGTLSAPLVWDLSLWKM